jgi:hypothetical protein
MPGRRWAALSLTVAVAAAVTATSAGVATASVAAPRVARPASLAPQSGLSLAQAPAGLRAAVARTLGAPAAGKRWPQQAELTASRAAEADHFGWAVAISGKTAVVGTATEKGAAYVFVRTGKAWSQQAKLTASNGAPFDSFGTAVAISGRTVLVGAPDHNDSTGVAYMFVRTGKSWSQQAELTASNGGPFDGFGRAVAISSKTALIGAPFKNSAAGADEAGAAYVFVRSPGHNSRR